MDPYLSNETRIYSSLSVVIRMNMVCTAVFFIHVLMCTAYTHLANTFLYYLSIEKQRSVVDARGLDLHNDI